MTFKAARQLVCVKKEVIYGVDPTPVGSDAILVYDFEYDREYVKTPSAKPVVPWLRRGMSKVASKFGRWRGWVELAGSGAAGTVPAYGTLLRACSFAEVNTPATDTQYTPVSTGDESAVTYANTDGYLEKVLGQRGAASFQFKAGELPRLQLDMLGLPSGPTDTALLTPNFTAWKPAVPVNKVNTPTFTIHGFAAVLQSLEINLGTVLSQRDMVGANDVQATDREPAGTITIELPTVANKNFWSVVDANTTGALQLVHGVGAGNIVQLDAPAVQLYDPRRVKIDGETYLQLSLGFDPSAGNDEVKLTVK